MIDRRRIDRPFVDPQSKTVLVQAAVEASDDVWRLRNAVVGRFGP